MLKPHGHVVNGKKQSDTWQCCHCGAHHVYVKGSGKLRGYCGRCNGNFCGPKCETCKTQEQRCDAVEQGIRLDQLPVVVGVHHEGLPWLTSQDLSW